MKIEGNGQPIFTRKAAIKMDDNWDLQ